jgi:hypothetical protein
MFGIWCLVLFVLRFTVTQPFELFEPIELTKLIKPLTLTLQYHHLLPSDFHSDSRVWIYQSDRAFNETEQVEINQSLKAFAENWKSHGAQVKGFGKIFFNQFIILMADETASGVSGCSTDSSVRLIKEIEFKYKTDLFNRQNLAFFTGENIIQIPLSKLNEAISNNQINLETYYFNNVVLSKKELEENWIMKLKNSWLIKKVQKV